MSENSVLIKNSKWITAQSYRSDDSSRRRNYVSLIKSIVSACSNSLKTLLFSYAKSGGSSAFLYSELRFFVFFLLTMTRLYSSRVVSTLVWRVGEEKTSILERGKAMRGFSVRFNWYFNGLPWQKRRSLKITSGRKRKTKELIGKP